MATKKPGAATRKKTQGTGDDVFHLVFENIQSGILIVDPETYTIIDANPRAAFLIGLPREKLIGSISHTYISPAQQGEFPITDLNADEKSTESVIRNARGERIPVFKTVTRVAMGGREYLIKTFVDIRDRKVAEERKLALIAFMNEAVARVTIPLGLTAVELEALADSIGSGECDTEELKMQVRIHARNVGTMVATLKDLASRCARERDDIPGQFREFITGK